MLRASLATALHRKHRLSRATTPRPRSSQSLSAQQQAQLEDIQDLIQSRREGKQGSKPSDWLEQAVKDQASDREILSDIRDRSEDRESFRLEVAEEWMDLIDGLDEAQKDQFIENVEARKQRKKQRRNKRQQGQER